MTKENNSSIAILISLMVMAFCILSVRFNNRNDITSEIHITEERNSEDINRNPVLNAKQTKKGREKVRTDVLRLQY